MIAELFVKRQDMLGEGMLYRSPETGLAWVDILNKRLMLADADGTNIRTVEQDTEIGAVLPGTRDDLILVLRNSVVRFDSNTGTSELLWSAADREPAGNRFNDAAVDPFGNLWIGSMDFDAEAPTGVLYRLSPDLQVQTIDSGFKVLNGPTFSPDGRTVYVGDTMAGQVLAYDCDPETGVVGNRRLFLDLGPFGGLPDGMTVDASGNVWACQITAGRIGCYAPDGTKLKSVALPVPMVTSCCFGGSDLSTLYVTTARIILDPIDLEAYPDSGSLYRIPTGSRGLAPNRFSADRKSDPA